MTMQLNGKRVVDAEVDGVDPNDYPDFCDTYFSYACYEDGTELNEAELQELGECYAEVLNEMAFEHYM